MSNVTYMHEIINFLLPKKYVIKFLKNRLENSYERRVEKKKKQENFNY